MSISLTNAARGAYMHLSKARRDFFVLLSITVVNLANMYIVNPILPSIHETFGQYSHTTIALLMTVVLIPLAIAPLVYGIFLSSLETKHVLQVCVLLMGLASIGCYFAPTFPLLLAFRLVHGLVIPAIMTCIMAHISLKFRGAVLQQAFAVYVATTIVGGLLGRVVGGFVASLFGNWNSSFLFIGIITLCILWPLRNLKKRGKAHFARIQLSEFASIIKTPGIKSLLFIESASLFAFLGIATYLPFFLTSFGEVPEWRISLLYLGYGCGIFIALYSRDLALFFGSRVRTLRIGTCIFLTSLIFFTISSHLVIFIAMCFVCMGQFLEHSISPGLINRMSKHDKGAVNGLYLAVYYTGGVFGSYVPGLIYEAWGWNVLVFSLMGMLAVAILGTFGLERVAPKQ